MVKGEVVLGKYRLDRELGRGGMGVVMAAHHLQLNEPVAIKFLSPQAAQNKDAVARFDREARLAFKIKSEHVVRVLDVGRLEAGAPYMVMEYLEGQDLASWLKERGSLPVQQAVDFILQVGVAVAEAHLLGIVHRDLKPSNLFCVRGRDGRAEIKVLDFGISKLMPGREVAVGTGEQTASKALLGSPWYMSPEQVRSAKDIDASSDIWAMGVVLFELLTGRVPFPGDAFGDILVRIVTDDVPPMTVLRPDLPAALEPIVRRCLEKDRALRFQSVRELAAALLPFAPPQGHRLVERIQRLQVVVTSEGETSVMSAPQGPRAGETAVWSSPGSTLPLPPTSPEVRAEPRRAVPAPARARPRDKRLALGLATAGACLLLLLGIVGARGGRRPPAASLLPEIETSASVGIPSAETRSETAHPAVPEELPGRAAATTPMPDARSDDGSPASPEAPKLTADDSVHRAGHAEDASVGKTGTRVPPPPGPVRKPPRQPALNPPEKPNCDPPYTTDANGNKVFIESCYKEKRR